MNVIAGVFHDFYGARDVLYVQFTEYAFALRKPETREAMIDVLLANAKDRMLHEINEYVKREEARGA